MLLELVYFVGDLYTCQEGLCAAWNVTKSLCPKRQSRYEQPGYPCCVFALWMEFKFHRSTIIFHAVRRRVAMHAAMQTCAE